MLKNYFKIAWRNIWRYKGYSLINILGLGVGLACSIIVFLYIQNELSYDQSQIHKDRIFRVVKIREGGGDVIKSAWSQVPMGLAIEQQFSQVEDAIRFWRAFNPLVSNGQDVYDEDGRLYFTDPGVFEAFSFNLVNGNPQKVLTKPGSVVLSKTAADKYFGSDNPVGKTLSYRGYPAGEMTLTVTAVMEDLPPNSQFAFDILVSLKGVKTEASNWGSHKPIWTYLLLRKDAKKERLEKQLPAFLDSKYESSSQIQKVKLEPLTKIHLYSDYKGGFKPASSVVYLYFLGGIGFLILFIACINFINLATARSVNRATEVGVRKTFGAYRGQLVKQFIAETFLLVLTAQILALFLVELGLPVFSSLADKSLTLSFVHNFPLVSSLVLLILFVSLGAGLYPAFVLSGFKPSSVFKNSSVSVGKGIRLRKALVIFQFSASIALIITTGLVMKQMDYIRNKRIGFDKNGIVVLPYSKNEKPLLERLRQNPDILDVSVSQRVPVNNKNTDGRIMNIPGKEEPVRVESFIVDDHFLDTYNIKLVAGRGISEQMASDTSAFLINETAVKQFGWSSAKEALGQPVSWSGYKKGRIVGVVRDFNMASLHQLIQPMVMQLMPREQWWKTFISVKVRKSTALPDMLKFLETTWKTYTPSGAYNYFFIDQSLEQLHRSDFRLAETFKYISVLAILIACLGLLGLVSFMASQRSREVAIRKVLGAGVTQILMLFNKEFLGLVLVGFLVAVPCTVYLIRFWLNNFAYRIDIDSGTIILAGLIALFIAALTVSWQSTRAALANPVDSLRSE